MSSSKSSRHRRQDRQRDHSESESESDGDRGSKRHHHHRRERHEKRDRHRSRSRSHSPGHHRTTKPDKHSSKNHKERNHSGDKRRERHQEEKIKEDKDEHREKHRRRDGDHDAGRSGRSKNGNQKEKEEHPKIPLRGKWENDPGAESDDTQDRASRTNQGAAQQTSQIRIKQERDLNDARRTQDAKRKPQNPFESQSVAAGPADMEEEESGPPPEKEKPNFGVSGKLTEDSNTYRGVVIKYNEPPEARKPKRKWRFYVFKGDEELPVVHIHRQSAYLLGRERLIADLPIDHPSCSKQHAVLQYRLVEFQRPDGTMGKRVRPYIIDLESSNGTYINNNRIEGKRYYELKEKDVVKFGYSTREYVLLHDKSKDSELDEEHVE